MLSVYSNQQAILNSTNTTKVDRIQSVNTALLPVKYSAVTFVDSYTPTIETHVYTPDGIYLTGNYDTKFVLQPNDTTLQNVAPQHFSIDLKETFESLGVTRGQFKLLYNVFDNIIGSSTVGKLFIKEISPSRQEIRLQLTDVTSTTLLQQYVNFYNRWKSAIKNDVFKSYVLNFGTNKTYQIINVEFGSDANNADVPEILVRLYEPLDSEYSTSTQLWISEEIMHSFVDTINIVPKVIAAEVNTLAGPNFNLLEYEKSSIATDFKSWNDLLGASLTTSQQLVDSQFPSGSLSGIKLNINYRLFDNFVHFSSATERVDNFYYKLQLIEHYSDQIQTVASVPGGDIANANLYDLYSKRNAIVSGFDDFEKYLFFESTGSDLYTNYDVSGSISPWPKTNATALTWSEAFGLWSSQISSWSTGVLSATDPYGYFSIQVRTDSETGFTYYNNLIEQANVYDRNNIHKLQNAVPTYLLDTEANTGGDELSLFVHMLGQHYDILWTYIKSLTTINTREEHPKDGMPNDLLYHVAASLGFPLLNGKSSSDLWTYSLGLNSDGSAIQNSSNLTNLSGDDNTKEIWRRIVNNLPYILKSKGTSRSIKALLSCFGIPNTILTIKEYGGPSTFTDNDHYPEYVHDVFHYAWASETGSLQINTSGLVNEYGTSINANTLEFRFKTSDKYLYNTGTTYNVFNSVSRSLTLTKRADNTARYVYTVNGAGCTTGYIDFVDNEWYTVAVDQTDGTGSFKIAKSLYGKTISVVSSSITSYGLPDINETITFASGSDKLLGHFQEIRLWSGSLNDATIQEHAASPSTYTYNVDRSTITAGQEAAKPYTNLLQRFTLSNQLIETGSVGMYQPSSHPNQKINPGTAVFVNYPNSGSIQFDSFEETYYTPSPSLGGSSLYTNKVRIDSGSIDTTKRLNTKTRVEKSSLEKYSQDSNRLGIYFSPQNAINEDIFNQLGYFEIDDYIGNPADVYNETYTTLNTFSSNYWKKYNGKNDFEAYFRALQSYDFTLFTYIKRLLPQRANVISGLVLEPNVLERSKVRMIRRPIVTDELYNANITNTDINPAVAGVFDNIPTAVLYENMTPVVAGDLSENGYGFIETYHGVNQTGNSWIQNRFVGKYKLTESASYIPMQKVLVDSRIANNLLTPVYFYSSAYSASVAMPYSSSFIPAAINKFLGTGYDNARYNGSKLIGSAINVDSPNTVDGGPVVKVTPVNPNQLVFSSNQITTINQATTGQRRKTL